MTTTRFTRALQQFVWACLICAVASTAWAQNAATAGMDREFTYSLIETDGSNPALLQTLQNQSMAAIQLSGGRPWAIWLPVELPDDAPFAGIESSQIGLMVSWGRPAAEVIPNLGRLLGGIAGVTDVTTRAFAPVVLPDGLEISTGSGFYVHRDEHYPVDAVDEAIRLSTEAWTTWEPHWGTHVVGLFREIPDQNGAARLTRIAWYADYPAWQATREFQQDPQSAQRFAERRQLLIEGSGVAIATDRYVAD